MGYISPFGLMQICDRYAIKRFTSLMRIGGRGYKAISRYPKLTSRRDQRLYCIYSKPRRGVSALPLEWWIGRGLPLSPYTRGEVVAYLLRELKPRQLRLVLVPDELFESCKVRDFLEWTLLRNWVTMWLDYLKWYVCMAASLDPSIEELLSAKPVEVHREPPLGPVTLALCHRRALG